MNRVKVRLITIISLCVLFAITFGVAIGLISPAVQANAATTYLTSSIFSAGTGGEVGASDKVNDASFLEFTLRDKGRVHFRRDLALKWYEAEKAEETEDTEEEEKKEENHDPAGVTKYLSLTFAFPTVSFKTFTVSFESAEENISKDGKATNSIVFQNTNGTLSVAVKNAAQQDEDFEIAEEAWHTLTSATEDIKLTLNEEGCAPGEFAVVIGKEEIGKFTNVGGYFMEYRSAASATPNTPITFTVELPEDDGATTATSQKVLMKELNGQTFKLDDSGKVVDDADAVLVLNETIYAFSLGQRFNLSYEAIDVCDDSVTVSRSYYMFKDTDKAPSLTETTDNHYKLLTTSTFFMPPNDKGENEEEFVSIRFRLDDGANVTYANLAWYASENAVVAKKGADEKKDEETVEGKEFHYIRVNRKSGGPNYVGITAKEDTKTNETSDAAKEAAEAYQEAVTEAAKNVNAGSGSYIYLPSLRGLISSEYTDYRNLRFSIYYYKENQTDSASASSQTSLRYNALKLEVDNMGWYKFRVLATDGTDNSIMLYENDELVKVTNSNIWDLDCIPEFTFYVDYNGAKIEDAGEQTQGSRNGSYTFKSFDIRALSGYQTEYNLYHFDSGKLPEGKNVPSYSDFVEHAKEYAENTYKDYLTEIRTFNSNVEEDSADWDDTDNDYRWNPDSSLSFIPQETGFYVLKVTVSDAAIPGFVTTGYQVVEVRNPVDTIPGQSQWLQDNWVAVLLFSLAGVCLVVLLAVVLVKPSDKSLDEVDLKKLKGGKKTKKQTK